MKTSNRHIIIAILLIAIASFMRVANASWHIYNFAPMAALGLFSGAVMGSRKPLAFIVPLAAQLMADLFFQYFTSTPGFYPGQFFNYGALALATVLGFVMKEPKPLTTLAFIFGASTLFFIVSNFGHFAAGFNGYNVQGFMKTYIDAIPFYRNTLVGDLIGGTVLFGLYFLVQRIAVSKMTKATV